jgi:hypothetical protein
VVFALVTYWYWRRTRPSAGRPSPASA